jgi:hypothetical protein
MDAYRLTVWTHLFLSIALVGLALFWFVMDVSLRRRFDTAETESWLKTLKAARWPHVGVPYALRIPLPWLTWVVIGLLVASGVASGKLTDRVPEGSLWSTKFAVFVALLGTQALLSWRPSRAIIRLNFAVVIATVVISVMAVR